MSSSTSEEKKNPVVTLKAQAYNFNFETLKAKAVSKGGWNEINRGFTAFKDLPRMRFIINKTNIGEVLTPALIAGVEQREFDKAWDDYCENKKIPDREKPDKKKKFEEFYNLGTEYTHLLPKEETGDYRSLAKTVFKEMFKYAEAQVPSDSILEELVTNCNQAGYEGALFTQISLDKYGLMLQNPVKVINIDCTDINHITVKSDMVIPVVKLDNPEKKLGKLSSSLEFTLESQDEKDDVTYKDGKLLLTIPRKLRDYKIDGRNLFDIIQEHFYKFCEKLGFEFETEIEHSFEEEDSLYEDEEYSFEGARLVFREQPENYAEDPDVDPLSNERGVDS